MSQIQPFGAADVPGVAELFMRVFRKSPHPAPESLRAYFADLYLGSPWADPSLPSYVSRRSDGKISGFIGSLPRRMILDGRHITVVVAGNHMVDQEEREVFTGSNLLRRVFDGPQELTITDSANEVSRRLWERLGGVTLLNYSLRWIRILRPGSIALDLVPVGRKNAVTRMMGDAAARVGDGVSRVLYRPPSRNPVAGLTAGELTADLIASAFPGMTGRRQLAPLYAGGDLRWLLAMAGRKEQFGKLRGCAVYDGTTLLGWYLFHARRPGQAHLLQLVCLPAAASRVIHHLLVRAFDEGLCGVQGAADPPLLKEYHDQKSFILLRDSYTVAHAHRAETLAPLLAGKAFLSRLDLEWWTRLQGDTFR